MAEKDNNVVDLEYSSIRSKTDESWAKLTAVVGVSFFFLLGLKLLAFPSMSWVLVFLPIIIPATAMLVIYLLFLVAVFVLFREDNRKW